MERSDSLAKDCNEPLEAALEALKEDNSRAWVPQMPQPDRMIRLLNLPKEAGPDGEIELHLKTYTLAGAPAYNALSYTWGCPVRDKDEVDAWNAQEGKPEVTCNGTRIPVGQTLLAALKCIIDVDFERLPWWVDALCIDQTNDEEKLGQIQLMGDIYSLAAKVVIWLGPSNGQTKVLNDYHNGFCMVARGEGPMTERVELCYQYLRATPKEQLNRLLSELARLLHLRWWTRKWTYQELLLAKFPYIMCGNSFYDMSILILLLGLFSRLPVQEDKMFVQTASNLQRANASGRMRLAAHMSNQQQFVAEFSAHLTKYHGHVSATATLMAMLVATANDYATEPEDNIRSVVGVTRIIAQRLQTHANLDFMAQSSQQSDLGLKLTRKFILELPFLYGLVFAGCGDVKSSRPSWEMIFGPEMQSGTRSDQLYNAGILDASKGEGYTSGRAFSWLQLPSDAGPLERLQLQAIKVGCVEHTQHLREFIPEGASNQDAHWEFKVLKAMVQFCCQMPRKYWCDTMPGEELFRTLFFGSPEATRLEFHNWATALCLNLFHALPVGAEPALIEQEFKSSRSITGTPIELAAILGMDFLSEFRAHVQAFLTDRPTAARMLLQMGEPRLWSDVGNGFQQTLFTVTGDRIGITARSCQVGDEIWVLQGGNWPYILRPTKWTEHYQLMGHGYVEGVMSGDFVLARAEDPGWQPVYIV